MAYKPGPVKAEPLPYRLPKGVKNVRPGAVPLPARKGRRPKGVPLGRRRGALLGRMKSSGGIYGGYGSFSS
jgi:hypothetical protein